MRKTSAALATLTLALLALTGCAGPATYEGAICDRGAAGGDLGDIVDVSGEVGSTPDVSVRTPTGGGATVFSDVVTGDGAALTTPDQLAHLELSFYDGVSGEPAFTTGYAPQPGLTTVTYWAQRIPGLEQALQCATAGSRVVASVALEDVVEGNGPLVGASDDANGIAVIDVVDVYPTHADGSLQYNDAAGMPTVVRAPDGRPGVIIPDVDAPADLQVQTLIKGDGDVVGADDTVLVNYTGLTWADKTVFDSSWDAMPARFPLSGLIEGFGQGLVGQSVGSQVLIVIPPELGYGAEGSGTIPPDSTLVFVVDILGVDPPEIIG